MLEKADNTLIKELQILKENDKKIEFKVLFKIFKDLVKCLSIMHYNTICHFDIKK